MVIQLDAGRPTGRLPKPEEHLMMDSDELRGRLSQITEKIGHWRTDARYIDALAREAVASQDIAAEDLLQVEETMGRIYEEIERFKQLVAQNPDPSPIGAALLAEVGDAIRLVLLEITELSTRMYSARSASALSETTPLERAWTGSPNSPPLLP